jgi:two-component system NarL family sensor kinase
MQNVQQLIDATQKMREQIALSESQFAELSDAIGIASVIVDSEGAVCSINSHAADMLGRSPDDLIQTSFMYFSCEGTDLLNGIVLNGDPSDVLEPLSLVLQGRDGRKSNVCVVPKALHHDAAGKRMLLLLLTEKEGAATLTQALQQSQGELQRFSNRLIAIHEGELRRVPSQLHDGIGQLLVMIKFMVEDALRHVGLGRNAEAGGILHETAGRLRDAI